MLAAMFAVDSKLKPGIEEDGAFFLDRDPKVFEVSNILNVMLNLVAAPPRNCIELCCKIIHGDIYNMSSVYGQTIGLI